MNKVRSEGLYQLKIPMTPSGIEPATSRFLTQHRNYFATAAIFRDLLRFLTCAAYSSTCMSESFNQHTY